jgi:hypothetical protein
MKKLEGGLFPERSDNEIVVVASNSASASASASDSTASRIKIKRKDFEESRTTVGWRINSSTVNVIKELAFDARMTINDFVQELLDKAIRDTDIE